MAGKKQSRLLGITRKVNESEMVCHTIIFVNRVQSFIISAQKEIVKYRGEMQVTAKDKALDSMDLLIQYSAALLMTPDLFTAFSSSPHALFLTFFPFCEIMWFCLITLIACYVSSRNPTSRLAFRATIKLLHSFPPIFSTKQFYYCNLTF